MKQLIKEAKRFKQLAGIINENASKEDIEYFIFGEGPTFTSSQDGGHPFYDWDLYEMIQKRKYEDHLFQVVDDKLVMVTNFDPYDFVDKDDFDQYWEENNTNGKITKLGSDFDVEWDSTLFQDSDERWYIIDKGLLADVLEANDATSEEDKQKLLNQ